jgi:TetR/AcrR family transcriptional regulator, repressor for uid operon
MPKLKPGTQTARREHILDSAELSFARSGFHRTTVQDICRDAGVSLGALYVYFASKEALIAGITERNRAKLAAELALVAAAPDLIDALNKLAAHYFVDEPRHKLQLVVDIGCESMRGGAVGEIFRACDTAVLEQFEALFARAIAEGKIKPELDAKTLAYTIGVIGDGIFWRRAVDPDIDAAKLIPVVTNMIAQLLHPTEQLAGDPLHSNVTEVAS